MEKENELETKKPEGSEGAPPAEIMFQERTRDPDEAVVAEQAIRHFVATRLADWYEQMESAIDSLDSWILQQGEKERAMFAERGFFDAIGDRFLGEMYDIAGGKGTPVMDAIVAETDNTVSWAQHSESDVGQFVNYMRRGVRDATWFVRDNVQALLSNQWPQLLDLAYEGSMDFVPLLYAQGLPTLNFNPQAFGDKLIAHADAYRKTLEPQKEQAVEQVADEKKQDEIEDATQKLAMDEETKKQQQAVVATL